MLVVRGHGSPVGTHSVPVGQLPWCIQSFASAPVDASRPIVTSFNNSGSALSNAIDVPTVVEPVLLIEVSRLGGRKYGYRRPTIHILAEHYWFIRMILFDVEESLSI